MHSPTLDQFQISYKNMMLRCKTNALKLAISYSLYTLPIIYTIDVMKIPQIFSLRLICQLPSRRAFWFYYAVYVHLKTPGWLFKYEFGLLNLRVLKTPIQHERHKLCCMCKIFCLAFCKYYMTFHEKYHTRA